MTKSAALLNFFNGFGLQAYPRNAVPDDVTFPWLTFDNVIGNPGDRPVSSSVNLWYRTTSEKIPNDKAEEIAKILGPGGVTIPYDEGIIWIQRDEPWCQPLNDENDSAIKRRLLNMTFTYL